MEKRRWIFRFQLASERRSGNIARADGIGHARRCISLARYVAEALGDDVKLVAVGHHVQGNWLESMNLPHIFVRNDEEALELYQPTFAVLDTNYLDPSIVQLYKQSGAKVINLAPRGSVARWADISFSDIEPDELPADPLALRLGLEYVVIGDDFRRLRETSLRRFADHQTRSVVVSFGGVDQANLAGEFLNALRKVPPKIPQCNFYIIVGPFNPHLKALREMASSIRDFEIKLITPRAGISNVVAQASLGIYGAGITTYESLAVGVTSLNIGVSPLHDRRGALLEAKGLARYFGRLGNIDWQDLLDTLQEWLLHPDELSRRGQRGMELIDGQGVERIVREIVDVKV